MLEDYFYHIYNRGNNRETIFKEKKNYYYFLNKFDKYLGNELDVYSYCLMPNHFHFLVKLKSPRLLPEKISGAIKIPGMYDHTPEEKAFKDFFICYSKSINKSYNRTGSLFQSKYKKKMILESNHLIRLIPYIHNNPVRAGLSKRNEDWEFSSYKSYLNNTINPCISNFVYSLYGSKNSFFEFHKTYSGYQKERDYLFK